MEGGGVWRVAAAAVVPAAVVAGAVVAAALRWNSMLLVVEMVSRKMSCDVYRILVTNVTTLFCLFMLDPVV